MSPQATSLPIFADPTAGPLRVGRLS